MHWGISLTCKSSLDPDDWEDFEREAHQALSMMIRQLRTVEERRVWTAAPPETVARFRQRLPRGSSDLSSVLREFEEHIAPYATGNTHPMFFGWVHGAGTPVGMVAEMLSAGLNANCGGRNHIGIEVERQIARWSAELFGFPLDASGLFVTGTSAANLAALLIARFKAAPEVRRLGTRGLPKQLTAYTSSQAHRCIAQAMEIAGIGAENLRMIPVDGEGAVRADCLADAIATDRAAGFQPFLIVGTAGTVNTGAVDDLAALAGIAEAERLWFHVDGAFGAMVALSPRLRPLLAGIERADSVAFDFHKWAHVPYDAGFVLVKDPDIHKSAFGSGASYLSREPSGLAAGETWPCDIGFDLSRGFRALKTWFTFQSFGADQIGRSIENSVKLARLFEEQVSRSGLFEVYGPSALNIVCLGLVADSSGDLNRKIVVDLHERGVAAPSTTEIGGRAVIRVAILNHRTAERHIEDLIEQLHISARRVVDCEVEPIPLRLPADVEADAVGA
jgi:aromatic-L-amino-acid decarboxylase